MNGQVEIDGDYLLQIAGEDSELVLDIVSEFERESVEMINNLKSCLKPSLDLEVIGRLLHKFKGSSVSLGMVSLSKVIMEMETWTERQWYSEDVNLTTLSDHLTKSVQLCKGLLM